LYSPRLVKTLKQDSQSKVIIAVNVTEWKGALWELSEHADRVKQPKLLQVAKGTKGTLIRS
jgi:hypothetical protein